MRFIGLLFVLSSGAIAWFLGVKGAGDVGSDLDNMRTRLAQLLNLPGLAPSAATQPSDLHHRDQMPKETAAARAAAAEAAAATAAGGLA